MRSAALFALSLASLAMAWKVEFYTDNDCQGALTSASGSGASSCASFAENQKSVRIDEIDGNAIDLFLDTSCDQIVGSQESGSGGIGYTGCFNAPEVWGSYFLATVT